MLQSIGASAFASLPQLTDVWVYVFLKTTTYIVFLIAVYFVFGSRSVEVQQDGGDMIISGGKWRPDSLISLTYPVFSLV